MLLGTILLALAWAALQGEFSLSVLVTGWILGIAIVWLLERGGVIRGDLGRRVGHIVELAAYFLAQIVIANIRVALDVLRPRHVIRPGVIALPLDVTTDPEILLLSAMINITPGSVTIDLSDDRRTLYVHVMHMETVEQTIRDIKDGFERRVLLVFR
ncbi:MAG TPA: Na+/H+ antiporter subunit E [Vicinamibacterales bacterium]